MNNLITLIFAASLIFSATATPKKSGKKFVWKFVTENDSEDDASERWREEANYWYDECEKLSKTQKNDALCEKNKLIEQISALEESNTMLIEAINDIDQDQMEISNLESQRQVFALERELRHFIDDNKETLKVQREKILQLEQEARELSRQRDRLIEVGKNKGLLPLNTRYDSGEKSYAESHFDELTKEKNDLEVMRQKLANELELLQRDALTPTEEIKKLKAENKKLRAKNADQAALIERFNKRNSEIAKNIKDYQSKRDALNNKGSK